MLCITKWSVNYRTVPGQNDIYLKADKGGLGSEGHKRSSKRNQHKPAIFEWANMNNRTNEHVTYFFSQDYKKTCQAGGGRFPVSVYGPESPSGPADIGEIWDADGFILFLALILFSSLMSYAR